MGVSIIYSNYILKQMADNHAYFSESYTEDNPLIIIGKFLNKFINKIKKIYNLFYRKIFIYINKMRIKFYKKYENVINPLALKYKEVDNFTPDGVSVADCTKRAKEILCNVLPVVDQYINDDEYENVTVQEFCNKVLMRSDINCSENKSIFQNVKVVLLTDYEDDKFFINPNMWSDLSDDNSDTIMKWCEKDIIAAQKVAIKYLKSIRKNTKYLKNTTTINRIIKILTIGINSIYRLTDEIFYTIMVSLHYQYETFKKALKLSVKYSKKAIII